MIFWMFCALSVMLFSVAAIEGGWAGAGAGLLFLVPALMLLPCRRWL